MKKFFLQRGLIALLAVVLLAMLSMVGCGAGATDGSSDQAGGEGELAVSLTDAPGEFATYAVDVLALTLTKANGAQVSTLPLTTRIDFAQYTEMTEFLTALTVPSGVYVAATLTLDYSDADIWVENESGETIQVAAQNIVDEKGLPLTVLDMTVHLEDRNRLVIAPGIPAHLLLDFDLNASHEVNLDNPLVPVVTVDPLLIVDVNRMPPKLHRVRGALNTVDVDRSSFSLFLRPFYCPLSGGHHHYGARTIKTDNTTLYEINGKSYTGLAGLEAMAALDPLTAVVAIGDLKFHPLRFEARQVYAGSSVPGGEMDVVRGNVLSRQDDTLVVKGATLIRGDSRIVFNDQITVQIGEDTVVTRQLSAEPIGTFDKDDISVGQKVVVFGTLSGDNDHLVMDASTDQSHVRMLLTTVRGTATAVDAPADLLTVELQTIGLYRVEAFDFSGTNSDPDNYQVYTGALNLSFVETPSPVKVRGFVETFGAAPPDFNAQTLISVTDLRARLKVHWEPASGAAFENVSMDGLTLNLENAERFHHIFRGWVGTDLTQLGRATSVVPQTDDRGLFLLRYADGSFQLFLDYEGFAEALMTDLAGGKLVKKMHATGDFDDGSATLTADYIDVKFTAGAESD